jgi:hypothetical protein
LELEYDLVEDLEAEHKPTVEAEHKPAVEAEAHRLTVEEEVLVLR